MLKGDNAEAKTISLLQISIAISSAIREWINMQHTNLTNVE